MKLQSRLTQLMGFPNYWAIDLANSLLKWGYYVPALIEQNRPDIELIGIRIEPNDAVDKFQICGSLTQEVDYNWLPSRIEAALSKNKKVALFVEDEHVLYNKNRQLVDIVNFYQRYSVYWCTQLDSANIDRYYRQQHRLQCKILELPWTILNECLMYDYAKHQTPTVLSRGRNNQNKFFTVTGKYESFRKTLIEKLIDHGLDQHGLITVQNSQDSIDQYALGTRVQVEPHYPYQDQPIKLHAKMAAQFYENHTWQSCNTKNFIYLEKTYVQYPLAIIPETAVADYFVTEKSIWPILLGKMFLIVGPVGCMQYIQRFYDVHLSEFLNLDFDTVRDASQKIEIMLEKNKEFILNSHAVYAKYQSQLQAARRTLGPNLYQFVLKQIDQIQ